MQIIPADETRLIDLPGVGPCPRPVDIDQTVTGFKRLKSLRIYRFQPGPPIHGDSEVDEVFITALSGRFGMEITGAHGLATERAAGEALYMTPAHSYLLTPLAPVLVAYARAEARGLVPSQVVSGRRAMTLGEHLRLELATFADGEKRTFGPVAEWLLHVAQGAIDCGGQRLEQGQTLALGEGESAQLQADGGAEVLILTA